MSTDVAPANERSALASVFRKRRLRRSILSQQRNSVNRAEMVTCGFTGRHRPPEIARRLPPGQSLTGNFAVLSDDPTPHIRTEDWTFTLKVGPKPLVRWSWAQCNELPQTKQMRDIHCVTKWSKLDTPWEGVLIDDILAAVGLDAPPAAFIVRAGCSLSRHGATGSSLALCSRASRQDARAIWATGRHGDND
jgi:DMSO/TMAO reductase YedYZ molybdopterin-dependent catalytic subunit